MNKKTFITFMSIMLVLNGCNESIEKGHLNDDGKLIIHVFSRLKSDNKIPVVLQNDYGIMIFNEGDESNPVARYELSDQKSRTIKTFRAYDELKTALSKIPKNSKIDIYDKCCVPTFYGLKDFSEEDLINFCKSSGLIISDRRFITCTCPLE
jgi:hypothetical protein